MLTLSCTRSLAPLTLHALDTTSPDLKDFELIQRPKQGHAEGPTPPNDKGGAASGPKRKRKKKKKKEKEKRKKIDKKK